jgi:hypothetical protein
MSAPLPLVSALRGTSPCHGGISAVMSHPALSVPATNWPPEAFEPQSSCGVTWDWQDILRFLGKVQRVGSCLLWAGARSRGHGNSQWYGSFWSHGKTVRAHKFSGVAILGLRPGDGEDIDHRCHHSDCVSCLRVLSKADNQARIRRPKKHHIELARIAGVTPAEIMELSDDMVASLQRFVAIGLRDDVGLQLAMAQFCHPAHWSKGSVH